MASSRMRLVVVVIALTSACGRPTPPVARQARAVSATVKTALEDSARAAGLALTRCANGVGVIMTTPGKRDATPDEGLAFLKAHQSVQSVPMVAFLVADVDSSGYGGCCRDGSQQKASGCVQIDIWEDSPAVGKIAGALAQAASETKISVGVTLLAVPTPRCPPGADCPPQPYESGARATPPRLGRRRVVMLDGKPLNASGRCSGDRECVVGCGCERYDSRARMCGEPDYQALHSAFCGCVEGSCAWFR